MPEVVSTQPKPRWNHLVQKKLMGGTLDPLMYCLMKAGQSFHSSGFTANYVEVGGPDNGVLQGVGNTAATFPGFLLPILGSYVMSKTGSYTPMCAPSPPSSPRVPGYGES